MHHHLRAIRMAVLIALVSAILTAAALLMFTDRGRRIRERPRETGQEFQRWVAGHRTIAPLIYIATFVILIVLMLPVWWLQILGGYGFGLIMGVLWSEIGATLGAVAAMLVSRWLAADWFHSHVEARLNRLRALDEKMGHNGLLVVIAVRLIHFLPVGISNYIFGLTTITVADVIVGTLLGGLPVVTWWVALGAGIEPWQNWRFLTVIGVMHLVLAVPIILRYLRPQWFRKYGIE